MSVQPGDRPSSSAYVDWEQAWQRALYGRSGFYRRPEGPAGHFRTLCHAAPELTARAVTELAARFGCRTIVDVGAGRGELLTALHTLIRSAGRASTGAGPPPHLVGVDVVERPEPLPAQVDWAPGLHRLAPPTGPVALVTFELLDVVPCPVVELDDDGVTRRVLVADDGSERPGLPAGPDDLTWLQRWWPLTEPGQRAEVGSSRDRQWVDLVSFVAAAGGGVALSVDYCHERPTRPGHGSLAAYRAGRLVPVRLDGSCDLTAHVAVDSVVEAGRRLTGLEPIVLPQHEALPDLVPELLTTDPGTVEALDRGGLGAFTWVVQPVPAVLPSTQGPAG